MNNTRAKRGTQQQQRMLPADADTERALLGALLVYPSRGPAIAMELVTGADFNWPNHQLVFSAITNLVGADVRPDQVAVNVELERMGVLDQVGKTFTVELMAGSPIGESGIANAAKTVSELAYRRIAIVEHAELSELYRDLGVDIADAASRALRVGDALAVSKRWGMRVRPPGDLLTMDLSELFPPPFLGMRTDGECLIAPDAVTMIAAPPESGKSMLACALVVEASRMGWTTAYVDYESTHRRVIGRLRKHIEGDKAVEFFDYIQPEDKLTAVDRLHIARIIAEREPRLVIIDGFNALLSKERLDADSSSDINRAYSIAVEPWRSPSTAVVLIDHVSKSDDKAGNFKYAVGSGAKTGRADYSLALLPDSRQRIRGQHTGWSHIVVTKDRNSDLRRVCAEDAETFGAFKVISDVYSNWRHEILRPLV